MGNEQSYLSGIHIEEKSVEVSDFWSHHSAKIENSETTTNLSVLIGELFVDGPLWKNHTPLEKNSKHLMINRHPCILKYISSWNKSSKFYLAVEEVVPLSHVLSTQSILQICIGLHSILKALCFLHEKAFISHNNICTAAIYVTKDGSWKLGGMEYACKYSELTCDYLKKSRSNRYDKAIDPNEEKHIQGTRKDIIDIFAFGVLASEVLKSKTDDHIPSLVKFKELAKNDLQNIEIASRPKLNTLLDHEFFNHEFIVIHSFLIELPLKSDEERTLFFHGLIDRLKCFSELTVASQFGSLLLSRLVLLNKVAQDEVLPFILCPKTEGDDFFSESIFKKYLTPKLLEIFGVRDAQIRLLLLNYFKYFVHTFTKEQLQSNILPELLLGVKDTNDQLVSATLRTLADLVPILGAPIVIGGKRGKLFTDGRPQATPRPRKSKRQDALEATLPERPRPDGEEGEEEAEPSAEEDLDENWEDWGENSVNNVNSNDVENVQMDVNEVKKILPDLNLLDIKNQGVGNGEGEEIDFFQDMEPVIRATDKFVVGEEEGLSSKLKVEVREEGNEDGWGEEEW